MNKISGSKAKKYLLEYNKQIRKSVFKGIAKLTPTDALTLFKQNFDLMDNGWFRPKKDLDEIRDGEIWDFQKFKNIENKQNKQKPQKASESNTISLKKLVSIAQSHKKNGISQEGLKVFNQEVNKYKKSNPSKIEGQVAGVLYNYLLNNIFLKKKRLPNNLNSALKELNLKTF
tara:strand:- start:219 stop:737 length:519 start_codon:yes stop_codon:yes gene_type:complete